MTTLHSAVLGPLTQDVSFADWYEADAPLGMPFFDGMPLGVTLIDVAPGTEAALVADADDALRAFRELTTTDRRAVSERVMRNYLEMLEMSDIEPLEVDEDDPDGIWRFVHPTQMYLSRRARRDHDVYVQIHCNCDWEEEHGLQLIFRHGRLLTRVSDIDGHLTAADAYDTPDAADELLSAYNARYGMS